MNSRKLAASFLSVSLVALAAGCGGGGGSTPAASSTTVTGQLQASYINGVTVCVDETLNTASENCDVTQDQGNFTLADALGKKLTLLVGSAPLGSIEADDVTGSVTITPLMLAGDDAVKAQRIKAIFHQAGTTADNETYDLSEVEDINEDDLAAYLAGTTPTLTVGSEEINPGFSNDLLAGNAFTYTWTRDDGYQVEEISTYAAGAGGYTITVVDNIYDNDTLVETSTSTMTGSIEADGTLRLDFPDTDDGATHAIVTLLDESASSLSVQYAEYNAADVQVFAEAQTWQKVDEETAPSFTDALLDGRTFIVGSETSGGNTEVETFSFSASGGQYVISSTVKVFDAEGNQVETINDGTMTGSIQDDGTLRLDFPDIEDGVTHAIVTILAETATSFSVEYAEYSASDVQVFAENQSWNFSLEGAWAVTGTEAGQTIAFIFTKEGTFVHAEAGTNTPGGRDGIEVGTYNWNSTTGELNANIATDTNDEWGFSHSYNLRITVTGDSATVVAWDSAGDTNLDHAQILTMTRISQSGSPIVGGWEEPGTPNGRELFLIFFADDKVVHVEAGTQDPNGTAGIEISTYAWNAATGDLSVSAASVDTNGEWGPAGEDFTFLVDGDAAEMTASDGEVVQLERVF